MNRGFTLLETLTVIVILGVLSVLAVPKVIDIVNTSEEKVALNSAKQYIQAVNKYLVENDFQKAGTYNVAEANKEMSPLNNLVEVSGNLPTGNTVSIDDNYTTINAVLIFGKYKIKYDGTNYTSEIIEK